MNYIQHWQLESWPSCRRCHKIFCYQSKDWQQWRGLNSILESSDSKKENTKAIDKHPHQNTRFSNKWTDPKPKRTQKPTPNWNGLERRTNRARLFKLIREPRFATLKNLLETTETTEETLNEKLLRNIIDASLPSKKEKERELKRGGKRFRVADGLGSRCLPFLERLIIVTLGKLAKRYYASTCFALVFLTDQDAFELPRSWAIPVSHMQLAAWCSAFLSWKGRNEPILTDLSWLAYHGCLLRLFAGVLGTTDMTTKCVQAQFKAAALLCRSWVPSTGGWEPLKIQRSKALVLDLWCFLVKKFPQTA